MMKKVYRVILGGGNAFAQDCWEGNFIGVDYDIREDISDYLTAEQRDLKPIYKQYNPDASNITAGLACGSIWIVTKGLQNGDLVVCPDGDGMYFVGAVDGAYYYQENAILCHRRPVRWFDQQIDRQDMSEALQHSTGSIATTSNISKYLPEIEQLLAGVKPPAPHIDSEEIEDQAAFELEMHLEDFLVRNWQQTAFANDYDIYTDEDGQLIGKQFDTGKVGIIDILAVSKDKKTLLVIELKRGRGSDTVVGQVRRYIGYLLEEWAEPDQAVRGAIIALEGDEKLRYALVGQDDVDFYRYQVSFQLLQGFGS